MPQLDSHVVSLLRENPRIPAAAYAPNHAGLLLQPQPLPWLSCSPGPGPAPPLTLIPTLIQTLTPPCCLQAMAREFAQEEQNHVAFIRTFLGAGAPAMPTVRPRPPRPCPSRINRQSDQQLSGAVINRRCPDTLRARLLSSVRLHFPSTQRGPASSASRPWRCSPLPLIILTDAHSGPNVVLHPSLTIALMPVLLPCLCGCR